MDVIWAQYGAVETAIETPESDAHAYSSEYRLDGCDGGMDDASTKRLKVSTYTEDMRYAAVSLQMRRLFASPPLPGGTLRDELEAFAAIRAVFSPALNGILVDVPAVSVEWATLQTVLAVAARLCDGVEGAANDIVRTRLAISSGSEAGLLGLSMSVVGTSSDGSRLERSAFTGRGPSPMVLSDGRVGRIEADDTSRVRRVARDL